MDVFEVRQQLVHDYRSFTAAFVEPRDERIAGFLKEQLDSGAQWPDPWLSLNPNFAAGGSVTDLVDAGRLHPECDRIFRAKAHRDDPGARSLGLYRHQADAIDAAATGKSYVLTTGTGSGKSLAYIIPIVDRVLRSKEQAAGRGVKAIIVYPMNALANSQVLELEKFLKYGYGEGAEPVTFARYTGQEKQDERRLILADPPDILLTNYVMLDLVLTRPDERRHLIAAAQGLQFLVLDELHTYRGRQGADVALLVRRVKDLCQSPDLQAVGTSATMASGGSVDEQKATVASVATRLFGSEVTPERVIGETLVAATTVDSADPAALTDAVERAAAEDVSADYDQLARDPLAGWIDDDGDGLGPQFDGDALADEAGRDRVEALAHADPCLGVDPGAQAGHRREPLDRQHPQRRTLQRSQRVHTVTGAGSAARHPTLPVAEVARLHERVQIGERVEHRHGGEVVAAEPADVALDAALLMGTGDAGLAEERLEPVVRTQRDEPFVLGAVTARQDLRSCGLQVVVADQTGHTVEAFERPDVRVGERLLGFVDIGAVERVRGERQPHREQVQRDGLAADHRVELAPIDLALSARQPGLRDEHLHRRANLSGDLGADAGHDRPALRLGDQHTLLLGKAIPDPLRGVALLARRVAIRHQHLSDPAVPRPRQRCRAHGDLPGRRLRRRQRGAHLPTMHPEPGRQRPDGQPLITTNKPDLLVQLHLRQRFPLTSETEARQRQQGQVGPTQTSATPPKWGQIRALLLDPWVIGVRGGWGCGRRGRAWRGR